MSTDSEPVVRAASQGDAMRICAIYNAALDERTSTFETDHRLPAAFDQRIASERFPLLVAETGATVVGWAGIAPYSSRHCYAGVAECSVYVAPEARGNGVGTALAEALATEAGRRDFHKLVGKLFTDNTASVRLVERCGFSSVGVHVRHGRLDGAWRDVLVVERLLDVGPKQGLTCGI